MDADQLVQAFKVAVHNLQVRNASKGKEPVDEKDPCALEVLLVLERILRCDLKHVKLFLATTPWDFLEKVSDCIPNGGNIKRKVKGMSSSGIGRARVFLRFGFNNGCLDEYLKALLWNQRLTQTYYGPDSVLLDEDRANVFLSLLDLLRGVSFKLSLQERGLEAANYWETYLRRKEHAQKRLEKRQGQQSMLTPSPGGPGSGSRPGTPRGGGEGHEELRLALKEAQEANVGLRVELQKAHLANETLAQREKEALASAEEMKKVVEIYRQHMLLVAPGKTLAQLQEEVDSEASGEDEGPAADADWDEALLALGQLLDKGRAALADVKAADTKAHARISHAGKRARTRSTMRQEPTPANDAAPAAQ